MCLVLDNSLFMKDRKKYAKISACATSFNSLYNKNNIIQDDIFNVLENYVARHDMPFEMLRYPVEILSYAPVPLFVRGVCLS